MFQTVKGILLINELCAEDPVLKMSLKPNKAFSRYHGHTKRAFVLLSLGKRYNNKNNNIREA